MCCVLVVDVVPLVTISAYFYSKHLIWNLAHLFPIGHLDLLVQRMVANSGISSSGFERLVGVSYLGSSFASVKASYATQTGSLLYETSSAIAMIRSSTSRATFPDLIGVLSCQLLPPQVWCQLTEHTRPKSFEDSIVAARSPKLNQKSDIVTQTKLQIWRAESWMV